MKKILVLMITLTSANLYAWDCKHEKEIEETLSLDNSQLLSIVAGAGDLDIVGKPGISYATATGRICASEEEWLDEAAILVESGREATIGVSLPEVENGWSIVGNKYVYMDLYVEVPNDLELNVKDSSGDVDIESTGTLTVRDSSGDIDIEDIKGDIVLNDSSGDIDLQDIEGNVIVRQDSSGDLYGQDIEGSVLVERDSSGDIRFEDVRDDFVVERDSSGDIVARSIGGDFQVRRDGSGDINHRNVSGEVDIPDDKS